ncbi:hypothetical protein Vafri_12370 [Volvox africanus]|uniref:Uncharacterized protein n=1 Tax=Volvox africanus TaxID=51714 RepID=A0A8J4BEM4_9CHLO|nr:hypothetical protein Vafri_12370 [Volvox africanus]
MSYPMCSSSLYHSSGTAPTVLRLGRSSSLESLPGSGIRPSSSSSSSSASSASPAATVAASFAPATATSASGSATASAAVAIRDFPVVRVEGCRLRTVSWPVSYWLVWGITEYGGPFGMTFA